MNRKIIATFAGLFILSMIITPFAIAKPGAEKNNEKFEFFELVCSGTMDGTYDKLWYTPPNVDPLENRTTHLRGGGWTTGDVVELTVGEETFTGETTAYNVDWTTTFDTNVIRYEDGSNKRTIITLTDVVTLFDGEEEIGTLVLNLKSAIDFATTPPGYGGTVQGYGTGALEGVHVSGIDVGLVDPVNGIFLRNGTIKGWPEYITNE